MRIVARTDTLLPAINPAEPASMLLWPEWLRHLQAAVSVDPTTGTQTWSRAPTIPASLMLTGPQREAVERRCTELDALARPGPERKIGESVAKILGFYAHGNASEMQATIKADSWIETLSDLPAWAVEEARRRWFAGKIRDGRGFPPDPADIRGEAEQIAKAARGQSVLLQRILNATPANPEVPAEDRARMLECWAKAKAKIVEAADADRQ